jgi:hypothetical protein
MPDFNDARDELNRARAQLRAARQALDDARQQRLRLEVEHAASARTVSDRTAEQLARLKRRLDDARNTEAERGHTFAVQGRAGAQLLEAFAALADPRTAIAEWSGDTPILLLPVRLETRFHRTGEGSDELWVRIYPDDCALDTFEATLSETEAASGRRYWIERWAAGGIPAQQRAAWRTLVASHGAGRSAWILRELSPTGAEPRKVEATDIVLTIPTDVLPTEDEQRALAMYWEAVWRAVGHKPAVERATAALAAAPGINDAARLIARFVPANIDAKPNSPLMRSDVAVQVAWLVLPSPAGLKTRSWTTPARVSVLPDRFVVLGYQSGVAVFEALGRPIPSPLVAGPDPTAPANEQIRHDANGNLLPPDALRWMVDFDAAVSVGMGLRVPLDPARVNVAAPIDRVLALGLRLADDAEDGRVRLEELLTHHRYGQAGFSFVPQGTPTNNTEAEGAGYSRGDDVDAAYDALHVATAALQPTADWWRRQDGQWLAEALGIDPAVIARVPHAAGTDAAEARGLNRLLWPATLGYAMDTMMHPMFGPNAVGSTRWFYTHFVSGRGFLPSVRIADQPYGVLPISALSKSTWLDGETPVRVGGLAAPPGSSTYLRTLAQVLGAMRADWTRFAETVSHVGGTGDPHQLLLDVLGLHPGSVEFHQRYAESLDHLFNRAKFHDVAGPIVEHIGTIERQQDAIALLRRLGYRGEIEPDALQRFFFTHAHRLNGPLIDDRPISEMDGIRPYTIDGRNYLAWLADVVRQSFEDLRTERGFAGDRPPDALLYVMVRHALLLGYWDASLRLHEAAGVITGHEATGARREPTAIHVAQSAGSSESRYAPLYSRDERVSGAADRTVAERIQHSIGQAVGGSPLDDQLAALDLLRDVPTARLERCLAEHIDTASFRLDAWLLGLVHLQLAAVRYRETPGRPGVEARRGIYLGAYGWLENLRRKEAPLAPVTLSDDLRAVFEPDAATLRGDPANGGFVLAPSLNHATTAAILRAGYLANASRNAPGSLAVNLSSSRVRVALWLIEGIRNGQPLGALLGYRLQRGLHEDHAPLELDKFVYPLRQQFPLVANQLVSTREPGAAIETIEANNVIDGLKLVEHVVRQGNRSYPFGLSLPPATAAERAAIDAEVERLTEANDALADLALAESVHQTVLGNFDAVASTLDAYSKGTHAAEPEVIRTPRNGAVLTHRVGLHFAAGVDPGRSPVAGLSVGPRMEAQPMVNAWLASILPPPEEIACTVTWIDPITGAEDQETVTQRDLDLQPIDLLYIVLLDSDPAMRELDDRIVRRVMQHRAPRADVALTLHHTKRLSDPLKSFFEVASLVRRLRSVLLRARPLVPTDMTLAGEAAREQDATAVIARARVQTVRDGLEQLRQDVRAFDPAAGTIDAAIEEAVDLFERAARFGVQQVGWGFLYEWRRAAFARLLEQVRSVVTRWNERLASLDAGLANYRVIAPTLTPEEQLAFLASLDVLIASVAVTPRPAVPGDYEAALAARRQRFVNKRGRLDALLDTRNRRLSSLVSDVQAELPLTEFDRTPFPIDYTLPELRGRMTAIVDRWAERLARFDAGLIAYNALPAGTTNAARFAELEWLDLLVAAGPVVPSPATPAAYVQALAQRRTAFDDKRAQLAGILASTDRRPEVFLAALKAELPLIEFDETALPLDQADADIQRTVDDLAARIAALDSEITKRLDAANARLQAHDLAADPAARVRALQEAGSSLLGEDVRLIPEFTHSAARAAELTNAYGAAADGTLLHHLTATKGIELPVDDWLHGVARVREKLFDWEQAAALAATLGRREPALTPVQLPFSPGEGWLALEIDPAQRSEGERLLYTAHYAVAPNAAQPTCGLLLDEWTEVVPGRDETVGLAFHYDRPASEPPQTWLLVTPPRLGGAWQWADVLGALDEAQQLARLRTVGPGHVDTLAYARFLPATTSAATLYGISIAANYGRVNGVMAAVRGTANG